MYRRTIITTAASAVLTLGVSAAPAADTTKMRCTFEITAQNPPKSPSGTHFGHADCLAPLGKGVQFNSYSVTPASPTAGVTDGTFKNHYNRGTTKGTFQMNFAASSPTQITYTGTVRVRRGTGAFRRVRGAGTITCTTTDGGAHKTCNVSTTLRGL